MPHNAMAALFGAAFLYAIVALVMGVRAFWRDIGEPVGHDDRREIAVAGDLATPASCAISMAAASAASTRTSARTDRRKLYHHLTFYGFMLCFAATCVATLYHYLLAREAPYAWWDLPVVLGTLGGIGLLIGPAGPAGRKMAARSGAGRYAALRHGCRLHR